MDVLFQVMHLHYWILEELNALHVQGKTLFWYVISYICMFFFIMRFWFLLFLKIYILSLIYKYYDLRLYFFRSNSLLENGVTCQCVCKKNILFYSNLGV